MRCIDLQSHPELGMPETRTAAVLAQKMKALGFAVTEKIGGTGLVAVYRNGVGPTVVVRTELDGLPMEEKTSCPTLAVRKRCSTVNRPSSPIAAGTTYTLRPESERRRLGSR